MARSRVKLSTGLPELDRVFRGLMAGDNIVWQVDTIEDYLPFVRPYADYARENRQPLIYFRFTDGAQLLTEADGAQVCRLDPNAGFEPFIAEIHRVISEAGHGTLFLFDCLSKLAPDWNSDRMLGNFFMLTCPHLYDRAAVAYFAILRNYHSFHAVTPISNTTQILVDAFHRQNTLYIHPIKVQRRYSATMYMLHAWDGRTFTPVTQSSVITETLGGDPWSRQDAASHLRGIWSKTFAAAEALQDNLDAGIDCGTAEPEYFSNLLRMLISRDGPVLQLASRYLTLRDLLKIRRRMIGTGLIGGKAVGMLLARAILDRESPRLRDVLEMHDSFYVGADVFYTYLVQNGCWWMIQKYKSGHIMDDEVETARRRVLAGDFPEYIVRQFSDMLDYFGQSPIIVRSSSLLEDNFGNAFAGKYDSIFCANQGGQHKRLEDFLCAVRAVYASTMSEEALEYRSSRGLLRHDEQMALLIQRVSGSAYGSFFYPQAAGVAFSFNPYVWHKTIDPEAGMVRLVFGVGTRAVERSDDDYTRVVALNAPHRRPEANQDEVREYAQRKVDVLDLEGNQLTSTSFQEIMATQPDLPIEMFASRDRGLEKAQQGRGQQEVFSWLLTFDKLLTETDFVRDMRDMLATIEKAYGCPVDTEFTLNFFDRASYRINLVQCRPLQVRGIAAGAEPFDEIEAADLVLSSRGAVIGRSLVTNLDWLIYVIPSVYGQMSVSERHMVARAIGEITRHPDLQGTTSMLLGPGRWGTTTPALGVPVSFAEISPVSILCEIAAMREGLVPDISLGTHFFNEMVENDMLYLAVSPTREDCVLDRAFFEDPARNCLATLLPDLREWQGAVQVIDTAHIPGVSKVRLNADTLEQRVVCYLVRQAEP